MINLAGNKKCDRFIKEELTLAGIPIIEAVAKGEVPYTVEGILGSFKFSRAWYYWVVYGPVPLDIAEKLYADPIGRKDVRVAGNCTCPPPHEWAFPSVEEVAKQIKALGIESLNCGELAKLCNDGTINGTRYINTYHIDSLLGLKLFADTVKALAPMGLDFTWQDQVEQSEV